MIASPQSECLTGLMGHWSANPFAR